MPEVEIVNSQHIDGREVKRGQVITVSEGRARDLIAAGKARKPQPAKPANTTKPSK